MSNLISQNTSMAGIIEPQGIKAFSSFSLRHYNKKDTQKGVLFVGFRWIRRGAAVNGLPVAGQSRGTARPQAGESTLLPFYPGGFERAAAAAKAAPPSSILFPPLCSRYLVFENSLKYNEEKAYPFFSHMEEQLL